MHDSPNSEEDVNCWQRHPPKKKRLSIDCSKKTKLLVGQRILIVRDSASEPRKCLQMKLDTCDTTIFSRGSLCKKSRGEVILARSKRVRGGSVQEGVRSLTSFFVCHMQKSSVGLWPSSLQTPDTQPDRARHSFTERGYVTNVPTFPK